MLKTVFLTVPIAIRGNTMTEPASVLQLASKFDIFMVKAPSNEGCDMEDQSRDTCSNRCLATSATKYIIIYW